MIGIIKTVAQQIHGTEIEMKVSSFPSLPPRLQAEPQPVRARLLVNLRISWDGTESRETPEQPSRSGAARRGQSFCFMSESEEDFRHEELWKFEMSQGLSSPFFSI